MAFLRFHRDKRGYEHFYLVESTTNRRGKTRARVLYWFRTPPNVKVGREPFDEEVRRTLETQNPGIEFDWQKISETPIPSAETERWRERRRQERAAKAARHAEVEEPSEVEESEEPEPPEDADIEATDADPAVDAAEQQADSLAPTEESLVITSAAVDASALVEVGAAPPVGQAEVVEPSRPRHARRRRRRRRHRGEPGGPPDHRQSREPRAPSGPGEADDPHEPVD